MTSRTKAKADQATPQVAAQRLVEAAGVKLVRRGADLVGRCPFHEDAGTSLTIDPSENTWACSVCKAGGSAVEWVMKAEGVSRRHALELLAEGLLALIRESGHQVKGRYGVPHGPRVEASRCDIAAQA
jgi:DNA primase